MGAGAYIGRIGGLAIALGIGAAVVTGHGVALADTTDSSGSVSSSTSTSSTDATDSSSTTSSTKTTTDPTAEPQPTSATATKKPEPTADSTPPTTKKRPSDSKPDTSTADPVTKPTKTASPAAKTTASHSDTTASAKTSDDQPDVVSDTEPTALAVTPTTSTANVEVQQPAVTATTAPPDPVEVVTTAVSTVVNAFFNPFAGNAPTAPVESPLTWTMLAAARRESFATAPSLNKAASPVTNSLTTDAAVPTAAPAVVAIEQTPPLAFLQQLPVIGPMFVTPIVAFIHQLPLIGDVLHPFIGYPIQIGLPAGTPTPRDVKVISFDGTPIYVHFMPASGLAPGLKAPTILDGPGLGLPGSTNPDAEEDEFLPNDMVGIAPLRRAGYNVVTWDPRGEWNSGGQLEVDSPDFEARDVSAIISWLATQPEVLSDDGDPRIGMVGASYGGGIQLVSAAIDPRIDAIVPTIAWHSLNTSLYKSEAFKSSWGTILTAALISTGARVNPRLYPAAIWGDLTGMVSPDDQALLDQRGPDELVEKITAPTLLIQGTVDTLFTLAEADENATILIANGVPTKVVWFCGGHGACLTSTNDGVLIEHDTLAWLDRYVKRDELVPTGPQFEWVDQHGQYFSSNTYPVPQDDPIVASSSGGVLPLLPFIGGSGPQLGVFGLGPIRALLGLPSGAPAINALNLKIPAATTTTYVVGAPQLTLTYSGTGTSRHVYAQLVDDTTGLVLGNLVTPVPVTLDGQTHTLTIPLEQVAQTLAPGETLTLQLVASAFPYETINSLGVLNVSSMQLSLPTADAAAISPEAATTTAA
ncbi:CocE/NonD family hydrolase [Mycobacterium sp. MMS18-G62]